MEKDLFGTDGIRGLANKAPMDATTVLKVGMAAGRIFTNGDHRHRVVIGKDTRLSGYMIEAALMAGFTSMGMDVFLVGPLPTPAVAMLVRAMRADLGLMISASHNSYEDNGVKLFGPDGFKLSDAREQEIEALVHKGPEGFVPSERLGRAKRIDDAGARYIEFVKATFPRNLSLDGLRIVVDCANGAAYRVAPLVFYELGAEVVPVGVSPDGFNINRDCGSTATGELCRKVRETRADLGIALDGDADRVIIADERGRIIDGDQLMAVVASSWKREGRLTGPGIVATVMSNLGLERYLESLGLGLARTRVGDRYVIEKMREDGYNVGGEQSGHMILSDYATTGDGLIAALQILACILTEKKKASEVCAKFTPLPQILKNVRFNPQTQASPLDVDAVKTALEAAEARLGASGRLLVRKSGTEPLIRVMGEGEDETLVNEVVDTIVDEIRALAS